VPDEDGRFTPDGPRELVPGASKTYYADQRGLQYIGKLTYRISSERVKGDPCTKYDDLFDSFDFKKSTCPVPFYALGGPGFLEEAALNRYQGNIAAAAHFSGMGRHVVRVGADLEF
jgi:hypothetical protein